jgi:hypothetical protein
MHDTVVLKYYFGNNYTCGSTASEAIAHLKPRLREVKRVIYMWVEENQAIGMFGIRFL